MVIGVLMFIAGKLCMVVLVGGMWLVDELEQLGEAKGVWDISHDVLVVGVAAHGVGTGIYHAHKKKQKTVLRKGRKHGTKGNPSRKHAADTDSIPGEKGDDA